MNRTLEKELLNVARNRFLAYCEANPVPSHVADDLSRSWFWDRGELIVDINMNESINDTSAGLQNDLDSGRLKHLVRIRVNGTDRSCVLQEVAGPPW